MTDEHLQALLGAAEAVKKDKEGFQALAEGRHLTLYAASSGVSLTVSRIAALKRDGGLVHARTAKGELYVLAIEDVFAGAVDLAQTSTRRAGFV